MHKNWKAQAAAMGLALITLTSCASSGDPSPEAGGEAANGPIKLAVMYGITGPYGAYADSFFAGFDASVEAVNDAGGIMGRPIDVELIDTRGDGTFAVSALTELLDSGYVPDAIVPSVVANETLAVLPMLMEREIFSITPALSPLLEDPTSFPYMFDLQLPPREPQRILAELMKEEGVKKLGVIIGADADGDAFWNGLQTVTAENGIEIIQAERPDPKALNFDVEYLRLMEAKPDAIFFDFNSFEQIGRAFSARATVGAMDIPVYTGISTSGSVPSSFADATALQACSMPVYSSIIKEAEMPAWMQPLLGAYEGNPQSAAAGSIGFDIVQLLKLAIERSEGDTSGQALSSALLAEPIPADYLVEYPGGFSYTDDYRFPTVADGDLELIPCTSTIADGLWVTK